MFPSQSKANHAVIFSTFPQAKQNENEYAFKWMKYVSIEKSYFFFSLNVWVEGTGKNYRKSISRDECESVWSTNSFNSTYNNLVLVWYWFWRYLTRGLIWHLSQSSIRPSIYFSSIVKSARICSWNQPVLSNKGKVSCSRKQRGPLMGP